MRKAILIVLVVLGGIVSAKKPVVYPNPTTNLVNIKFDQQENIKSISVYNFLGDRVRLLSPSNALIKQVDLNGLPKGKYFVQVVYGNDRIDLIPFLKK